MSDTQPPSKIPDSEPEITQRSSRFARLGLPMVLLICIGIALVLTAVSIGLYFSSNLSRIDLSKPRYADVRNALLTDDNETGQVGGFDNNSPITEEAIKEALVEMRKRRQDLQDLGDFSSPVLEDSSLGIGE